MGAGKYIADRSAVLIGLETTPGVYEEPSTALPIEKGSDMWVPEFDKTDFDPESGHHGSKETTVITEFATMPVKATMKLPNDHTLISAALVACGMESTAITGGVSYSYTTSNKKTASFMQVSEREITRAYGERGDFTITCEVGNPAEISFEFDGMFKEQVRLAAADPDNTIPDTPAFDQVFMTKNCTAYLVNGNQAHFTKVELKLGASIGTAKDTCPGESWTKDIKPEMTVSIMDSIDNQQSFADLQNGTEFNFVIPLFDKNGVKKWEIIAPKCVVIEHKKPKNEGRIALERTFELRKVNGDDNFEIRAYTA